MKSFDIRLELTTKTRPASVPGFMEKIYSLQMSAAAWCALGIIITIGIFVAYYLGAYIERKIRK